MVFDPGVLVVGTNSKLKTVNDLLEAAKKAPGTFSMAHSGNGIDDWFNGVMIEKLTGVTFNLVVDFKKGETNRKWLQEQNEKLQKIVQEMGLGKK